MPIAFRILDNRPVYLDDFGRPVAGGRLDFFEAGTLDPKEVFEGPDLSVSNGVSVELDSSGRTSVDTWGDGAYKVRLYAADGVFISEADNVQVPGGAAAIPTPEDGKFLTSVGGVMVWGDIIQALDPTGQNGKTIGSDGTNLVWVTPATPPTPPDPEIVVTPGADPALFFRAGISTDATKMVLQSGTKTCAASGGPSASDSVTFPTAFSTPPVVMMVPVGGQQPGGMPVWRVDGVPTVTGFTARFDVAEGSGASPNITNAIPYHWMAFGTLEVP